MSRALLLYGLCVSLVLGGSACSREDATTKAVRALASAKSPPPSMAGVRWRLLQQIYHDHEYRPFWFNGTESRGEARDLVETLCHADREGLRAADYDLEGLRSELRQLRNAKERNPAAIASVDLRLTRRFLDYGADLLAGRLDPLAVDNGWYIRARRANIDSLLRKSLKAKNFDDMISPLRPLQREYKQMVEALEDYRELQAEGGWPQVPGRRSIVRGEAGAAVAVLRQRLHATDDLKHAGGKPVYDDKVAAAVAHFQERHGLPVDSSANIATLAALNVPVETRIRQIELNLERYRWLPGDFGKRYILVNIPDYRLYAYNNRKEVLTMRVIVGDEYGNATPVFADSMTYVVFHPEWDMPHQILVDEVIPKVRENIYYLAQHGYEIVDTAHNQVITDPASIDWSDLDTTKIDFRVRQKAGSGNALGKVKFMFPNQFSIYLHDTPANKLFQKHRRTLSHGCVRVEDPISLAGYVLDHQQNWDEEKIRDVMELADSQPISSLKVDLERPLPVYLLYLTAFMRDGVLNFRDDPYGKDRRAMAGMGKPRLRNEDECKELMKLVGG